MIFTLYSYKGGVGRSMALANVAHWFYLRGLNVVMVDWDLEAPGLETFFYKSADKIERVRSQLGVIDLLSAYCRQFPYLSGPSSWESLPPMESYLCEIEPEVEYQKSIPESSNRGRLRLLSAGWRSGERFADYAEAVHAFDWPGFYARFRGEEYFNWLRGQLASSAPVVLVDSRTGITEMGGVCTRHLADVVVIMCAPNSQNLQGALEMADSFQSDQLKEARKRQGQRPLEVLILPARVDDQDSAGYGLFRGQFVSGVERFTPEVLGKWKRSPWDLAIPYKSQYSYGETLVTGVEGSNENVVLAYKQLATHMALFSPQGGPLWNACLPELKPLAAAAGIDILAPTWLDAEAAVGQFTEKEFDEARRVLLRLVHLSPQSPSLDSRRRSTRAELEGAASTGVIDRLVRTGVIVRAEDGDGKSAESLELAHESVVSSWPRLREWIQERRPSLLWRQDLAAQAAQWMAHDRDPALLLRGGPLREALEKSAGAELNSLESTFVESSHGSEEERKRVEREQAEESRRVQQEARRRRVRLRAALATAATLALLLLLAGLLYVRSNEYQAKEVVKQGVQVIVNSSLANDPTSDWRDALLASGHVTEALAGLRQLQPSHDKFLDLASAAVFLRKAGQGAEAASVAAEALNFKADSLKGGGPSNLSALPSGLVGATGASGTAGPGGDSSKGTSDYARTLVDVWSTLANNGFSLPKDQMDQLISTFTPAKPEEGVAVFRRILPLVDSPDLRKKYHAFALGVTDNGRRCSALTQLLFAAGKFDPSLVPGTTEEATQAAIAIPDSDARANALLNIADAHGSGETWANVMKAIQSPPPSVVKIRLRVQVGLRLAKHKDLQDKAADQFAQARKAASSLDPDNRASVLQGIAAASPDEKLATQVLDEAASITKQTSRIIGIASAYARLGDMGIALELVRRVPQEQQLGGLFSIAYSAQQKHRMEDARLAARAAADLYLKQPSALWNQVIAMIPILYPDDAAAQLAAALSTPDAYLYLAQAARAAGNAERARGERDHALALARKLSGDAKSAAVSQIAQDYAVDGRLYAARSLADQCDPNDRLAAYATILNAHTIQAHPQLRKVIGGVFQTGK